MLFDGRQESRQRYAHGVETRRQILRVEISFCVGEKLMAENDAGRFRKYFDGGAQLGNPGRIAHDSGNRSGSGFVIGLRGCRRSAGTHTQGE